MTEGGPKARQIFVWGARIFGGPMQRLANLHLPCYDIVISLVYDLKSVGALKIGFVAPTPEQNGTSTMHFSNVSGEPC